VSGPASFLGDPEKKTLEIYVDEINAKGGVNGQKLQLVVYDDAGSADSARTFATRLVEEDKIVAMVGGSTTGATLAMIQVFEDAKIPFISLAGAIQIIEPVHKRIKVGESVFVNNCQACHQANGAGVADAFPPLAKSDYLNADKVRAIKAVTGGLEGKLTVNSKTFNGVMPAWDLPDEDIANVMTYIYNNWGNSGLEVRPADVQANRVKKN